LVATLERRLEIGGGEAVLCGLAPAITAPAQRGQPMGFAIPAGRLYLGHRVARRLGVKQGDPLAIGGMGFAVDRVLAECGTDEDIKVFGLLSDVQRILGLEGRISEIKAIDCICRTGDRDPLAILRAELEEALPEAQVVQLRSMAEARARQRLMAERYASFGLALLLVLSAAIVCCLAVLNVRERRGEIGILRALGHRSGRIAALILGRALVVGGIGALVGAVSGSAVASVFGREVFRVTAGAVRAEPAILLVAAIAAPAFAALASAIPTVLAVTQDPATTLREV
jgi:ABC-type lipoprotein release transport system permease subunit